MHLTLRQHIFKQHVYVSWLLFSSVGMFLLSTSLKAILHFSYIFPGFFPIFFSGFSDDVNFSSTNCHTADSISDEKAFGFSLAIPIIINHHRHQQKTRIE